ncbi:TetR family transcriptional regulator [Mycobacterium sp. CBMA 234]|uniref:TetR/AcrR family transcriptional regulator n=2 Tax=unclassified Mycolicibacterium TaxID=2636767 RepID=UPI0012DD94B3|nr:TetR/AcrR family transcriptional regulator [Mycolicibacterium sp. CBMA 234]MUL64621.1 TetR family transcriptional regulator [Mycolicibacterium sp. CBMA 234]
MTTDAPGASDGSAPVGRDEVVAAILEAAAELFAARGPAATSIRDIAAKSNVNHGLVFRHLGAKEKLVGAVLDHLGQRLEELIDAGAPPEVLEAAVDRQVRVIVRVALDGYPVGELQTTFPTMTRLLDELRPRYADETQARLAVANIIALQLGWRLLGPFLRPALGLGELTDEQVRAAVGTAVGRLAEPT